MNIKAKVLFNTERKGVIKYPINIIDIVKTNILKKLVHIITFVPL